MDFFHPRLLFPVLPMLAMASIALGEAPPLVLKSGPHEIGFSSAHGSLLFLKPGGSQESLYRSGESGLWQARFRDGQTLNAAEFQAGATAKRFESQIDGQALLLKYQAPELSVVIRVTAQESGFDLQGQITPATNPLTEFTLPAALRFASQSVRRFVSPLHPHLGVGAAFRKSFFEPQPVDQPSSWKGAPGGGPAGYRRLFGDGLDMRDLKEPAVAIQVTPEAKDWLGETLAGKLAAVSARVSRPSKRAQVDLVLLDSPNGPFLSASHLGGKGFLWRFGGLCEERDQPLAVRCAESVIRKLASAPHSRRRIALVSVLNGPNSGSGSNGSVLQWRDGFQALAQSLRLEFAELRSAEAVLEAVRSGDCLAVLNPYGEWLPVPEPLQITDVVDAIGQYTRAGGNWFEVGGYPFYSAMRPSRFLRYESAYPPVFADFLHLDAAGGTVSLYRIQPRTWAPWSGAANPAHLFVPGRLAFGGDEQGGWCERAFGTYVLPGQTWTAPLVRINLGQTAEADIQAYCQANAVSRTLRDKLAPDLFEKLRHAVLLRYTGNAQEMLAALGDLPVPSLIHYAEYLKGGFDKEYPDHLPPHPRFGTPQELRALHDRAHALGHLVMPYTNPTWWCDHPRGPSFEQAGDAPLLRDLEGKPIHEQYAANDGWTTCFWHPAVRAANRRTLREFTDDYPVDLLFQDQCGARGWRFDTNPASPTPFAYAEGLLSQVDEDCQTKPLSTEDGWDRVVNAESQLCGFTFALGPGRRVTWAREMKAEYHPSTWELYPFAQRIAHDKVEFFHHDLGKFVTDRPTLSWTLGLGFAMSYIVPARALGEPRHREWLRWLDRIQKSVCARYIGEPAGPFEHRQGSPHPGDDGSISAEYGAVRLRCNLSPNPRTEDGLALAGYGFHARAPGMAAGNLQSLAGLSSDEGFSYVSEGNAKRADLWVFAPGGTEVAVELPAPVSGPALLTLDGQPALPVSASSGAVRFRLPPPTGGENAKENRLWHGVVSVP